ncbi:MAG: GNAT family N-acetyltransferase [archaeon]
MTRIKHGGVIVEHYAFDYNEPNGDEKKFLLRKAALLELLLQNFYSTKGIFPHIPVQGPISFETMLQTNDDEFIKRLIFDHTLRGGSMGKYCDEAWLLYYKGKVAGFSSIITNWYNYPDTCERASHDFPKATKGFRLADHAMVLDICVHPDYAGIGLGTALLDAVFHRIKLLKRKPVAYIREGLKSKGLFEKAGGKIKESDSENGLFTVCFQ